MLRDSWCAGEYGVVFQIYLFSGLLKANYRCSTSQKCFLFLLKLGCAADFPMGYFD